MVYKFNNLKMQWYPWLTILYKKILLSYQQSKGHHALLLHTHQGNGEERLMYAIGRWLICNNPKGIQSCRVCRSCLLMKTNNHPDYHVIMKDKKNFNIGIDQIRIVIDILYQSSYKDGIKIVLLSNCECLTEQAMNALLKILEEPPANTYFLLGCYNYDKLLPTLLSRCCYWFLPSPPESEGLLWLKKTGIQNISDSCVALRLCNGAPLAAQSFLQSQKWEIRKKLCNIMFQIVIEHNFFDLLFLFSNDNAHVIYLWLFSLLIDSLKWQLGIKDVLINIDQKKLINFIAINWSMKILYDQLKQWIEYGKYLNNINNINQELLLANQLLNCERRISNFYRSNIKKG